MGLLRHLFFCKRHVHVFEKTAVGVVLLAMLTACGDTFRPVANPIPRPGGDPGLAGEAIVVSTNGSSEGTTTHINISGDTVVAIEHVGANPVHAIIVGGEVLVANQGGDSLSFYPASVGPSASVSTTGMPTGSQPSFLNTTDNINIYIAEPGINAIGVVPLATLNSGSGICAATQPAPCIITDPSISNPVAIAQLPGGGEIYVANQGSKVTVIDPATLAVKQQISTNIGTAPAAIVASADGNCVYVADSGSSDVAVINTSTKTATQIGVGGGPSFLRFDPILQRVYVVNQTGNSVSVIAHAADCSSTLLRTIPVGAAPKSIAALSDKTRAYVANSGDGTVSVIDTSSNTVRKTIVVGGGPVSVGASADATKVVVATGANVVVIRTSDDTVIQGTNFMPTGAAPNPQLVLMNP